MARWKKLTQREVSEGLRRLAFGEIKDAVTLLYESEDRIIELLPTLDLFNVSEIKRAKGGGMEIKFFDRLKALERLREMAEESDSVSKPTTFYEALEKGAQAVKGVYAHSDEE